MSDVRDSRRAYYASQAASAIKRVVKRIAFEGAAAQAALSTALTGANNDLDFEAQDYGSAGNDITIEYQAPTAANQDIDVTVEDNAIVVALGSSTGTDEVQTVTVKATGGTFILGYRDKFTQPIAYNATTTTVQERLRALPGLSAVTVTGVAGAWIVTFVGENAGVNVATLQIDGNRLMPKAKPRVDISVVTVGDDSPATNEVVKVTPINAAVGTFTLTFGGDTTTALAYNVSAAAMQTALRALAAVGGANLTVTGSAGGPYTVTFIGTLAAQNVGAITADASGLRVASVAVTTPGVAYAIDSTANDVITAIEDNTDAAALVNVTKKAANDGSGVVTAMAATHLAGGKEGIGTISDAATAVIDPTGTNNSLTYTAVEAGNAGNGIRIVYVDPGGATAALSVVVDEDERLITVNLGRAASAINTTAALLKTAYDAVPEAVALATVANTAANDGTGLVTAMPVTELSGGGGETSNGLACFIARGDVNVAANLLVSETLAGATGTLKLGTSSDDDNLIPSIVGTTMTVGKTVDKSGLVATLTAPNTTPHQLISDGQTVYLKPGVADLTDGTIDVVAYYQSVSEGGRLVAVD